MASSLATAAPCRLLTIARELRDQIWEEAFKYNIVNCYYMIAPPSLLLACKQTHTEARAAYFSCSTFQASNLNRLLETGLHATPKKYASLIKLIRFEMHPTYESPRGHNDWGARFILARDAQREKLAFEKASLSLLQNAIVQIGVKLSGGTIVWTTTPWKTFETDHIMEEEAMVKSNQRCGVMPQFLVSGLRLRKRMVEEQSRKFG